MTWLVDPLRRLRSSLVPVLGLAGLVAITAFAAAAGPRLFAQASRQSIATSVTSIPAVDRVIELSETDTGQFGTPAFQDLAAIDQKGAQLDQSMPSPLPAVTGGPIAVIETPSYRALEGASLAAEIRLRVMEGVADHIRLVAGAAPTDAIGEVADPTHTNPGAQGAQKLPQFEAEISSAAAQKLGLTVGSALVLGPDTLLDPLAGGGPIGVKIVGIYVPNDVADSYWVDDGRVTAYTLREFSSNITFVQSDVLLSADTYGILATGRANQGSTSGGLTLAAPALRISWRIAADPSGIDPDNLSPVVSALRRLQTQHPTIASHPSDVTMETSLLRQLVALQGPWSAAAALLAVAAIGASAVALASLALVTALTAEDRRRIVLIQRERGASAGQAIAGNLVEAILIAVPAGVVGIAAAVTLVPGVDDLPSFAAGGAVILAAVLFQLGVILGAVLGPPRLPSRARAVIRGARARRLVFDAVIVGLAIAGAAALRQRGLEGPSGPAVSSASGVVETTTVVGNPAPDPLLLLAPVLVGIAAAVVAIRVAPIPFGALAWLSGKWRGLPPALATRRAARDSGAARVLLIVLAIATLGAFASATVVEMANTAQLQSWQDVGAPYRIDASADFLGGGAALPDELDPTGLPGVTAAVRAHLSQFVVSTGGQRELVALDLGAYAALVDGSPVALQVPSSMLAGVPSGGVPSGDVPGTPANPLPAAVNDVASGPFAAPKVGDEFTLTLSTQVVSFRTVAVIDAFPGVPGGTPFVLASWPQIDVAAANRLTNTTSLFAAAPPGDGPAIQAAIDSTVPGVVVHDRAADEASLAGQGVVNIVSIGVAALAAIALLYAALAVVSAFVLTAASRADETAHLSTLGLSPRQSGWMLLVEFGPPVALAVVAGAALGLGLFAFLSPGLGLTTIVGALQAAPPGLDLAQVGLLAVLIGGILLLGVALGAPAQRRAAWASVRRGLR